MTRTLQATQNVHLLRDRPGGLQDGLDAGGAWDLLCHLLGQDSESISGMVPQFIKAHLVVHGERKFLKDELRGRLHEVLGGAEQRTWIICVLAETDKLFVECCAATGRDMYSALGH